MLVGRHVEHRDGGHDVRLALGVDTGQGPGERHALGRVPRHDGQDALDGGDEHAEAVALDLAGLDQAVRARVRRDAGLVAHTVRREQGGPRVAVAQLLGAASVYKGVGMKEEEKEEKKDKEEEEEEEEKERESGC